MAYSAAAEETHPVKTVDGAIVQVAESELRAAAEAIPSSEGVNVAFANENGSVTFRKPRYRHNGSYIMYYQHKSIADLYCRDRGFPGSVGDGNCGQNSCASQVGLMAVTTQSRDGDGAPWTLIYSQRRVPGTAEHPAEYSGYETITCAKKE